KLYSPRPVWFVQLMMHGPAPAGEVPSNKDPLTQFSPLNGSPHPAPSVKASAGGDVTGRRRRYTWGRPAISVTRMVLDVPSVMSRIRCGRFARSGPFRSPPDGGPTMTPQPRPCTPLTTP